MLGFTEEEMDYILDNCNFIEGYTRNELKNFLKANYNGYLFNKHAKCKVYNSNMLLNFLGTWQRTKRFPEDILDPNVNMDRARILMLAKNENNRKMLEDILFNERIMGKVEPKFSFEFMYKDEYFVSLLFYLGMLTIDVDEFGFEYLIIPNYVSKVIYWDYMKLKLTDEYNINVKMHDLTMAIANMAIKGDISGFINYVSREILSKISNRDLIKFDEKNIKLLLMAYVIQTGIYRAVSERECEEGYIDLIFERHEGYKHLKYDWMIEIKYLKESERAKAQETLQKAKKQLEKYALESEYSGHSTYRYSSGNVAKAVKQDGCLKLVVVVFIGKKDYIVEELW